LHFLLLDAKPERLIIETSGLGHPARLLDMLRNNYRDRLEVHATLGLVDPADFARPEMRMNRVFLDQIDLADVLVMNKLDLAEPTLVAEFQRWANELDPPKLLIVGTTHGQLDPAWLDLTTSDARQTMPRSHEVSSGNVLARGWVFAPNIVFDRERLLTVLHGVPDVSRLKGIFHVGDDWIAVNRTSSGLTCEPTAYRRDSRIDVFAENLDWTAFGKQLETCILARC
jgi:G3E family GTPase